MTRFIGWALQDIEGHAHILAISDGGTVVMRDWTRNDWRAWGRQTFNEGSIQIQNAIQSWEDLGYERSDPVTIKIPGDWVPLTEGYQRPDREQMDRVFQPLLNMAGIISPEPAVPITIAPAQPLNAAVGTIWFDNSANSTYTYNGSAWMPLKGKL